MSEPMVVVENLGKRYTIGAEQPPRRLSDIITDFVSHPGRHFRQMVRGPREQIWALRDVSFEVGQGEVVGIIGRNGAGKSTLLKILSRITDPTEGLAVLRGKLGSLLEVGIGFHPDLTGRENVYLNGVILGMSKSEVDRKFEEIVSFAEVQKFIDTPMKHYSSGMYVRLAFAVAAHLEPDILVIDEVLAVGDSSFQQKCLGKLGDVAKEGRTVLFVSHNMPAIMGLCPRSVLLDGGRVVADGPTKDVLEQYLSQIKTTAEIKLADREDRKGDQRLKFTEVELRDGTGTRIPCGLSGDDLTLAIRYQSVAGAKLKDVHVEIEMYGRFHESLFQISTEVGGKNFDVLPADGVILVKIPHLPLQPGLYTFDIYCTAAGVMADYIQNAAIVRVEGGDFFGTGKLPQQGHGTFLLEHSWAVTTADAFSRTAKDV